MKGARGHFSFDDGLQGWIVETDRPQSTTWEPTLRAAQGLGAVGTTELHPESQSVLRSPVLNAAPSGPTVVRFEASWWTEGQGYDFVDVLVREVDRSDESVLRLEGRGNWPSWDPIELDLGPRSQFELAFMLVTDETCDDERRSLSTYAYSLPCRVGVWIDEVQVLPADPMGTSGAAFVAEDLDNVPIPRWPWPTGIQLGYPVAHDEAENPIRRNEWADALANPEYLRKHHVEQGVMAPFDDWFTDPFHREWDGTGARPWTSGSTTAMEPCSVV